MRFLRGSVSVSRGKRRNPSVCSLKLAATFPFREDIILLRSFNLREALAGLQDAEVAAQDYLPYDCIVIDVRSAIDLLGEITGDTVQDEIINEIFERFCIGK